MAARKRLNFLLPGKAKRQWRNREEGERRCKKRKW